jgi:hypothetical protein
MQAIAITEKRKKFPIPAYFNITAANIQMFYQTINFEGNTAESFFEYFTRGVEMPRRAI